MDDMMNDKEKDLEDIVRYFELKLSETELQEFETRLLNDPEFLKKLIIYKNSIDFVEQSYNTEEHITRINKWKALINQKKKNTYIWAWSSVAALLILFFGLLIIKQKKQSDFDTVLKDSWNKKIGLDYNSLRGAEEDSLSKIILYAFNNYEDGNYSMAIDTLYSFNWNSPYFEDALLIKALSEYKRGNLKLSIQILDTLARYPSKKKAKVALWYKGLIYLELGDTISAKQMLVLPNKQNSEIKLKK